MIDVSFEEIGDAITPLCKPLNRDPNGLDQHQAGAKLDSGKYRPGLVISGFCNALQAVSEVGTMGANKYTDFGFLEVENGVSRYTDALYRHLLSEHAGEEEDKESGLLHAAHAAWNALARLELMLREEGEEDEETK